MQVLHVAQRLTSVTTLLSRVTDPQLSCVHHYTQSTRKFPDLLYFPHVLRWMATKLKFKYLQKAWDPEFSEGAFIYGSTHAICKITEIINRNEPDRLRGLLTVNAELNLRSDMEYKLSKIQKDVLWLRPHDIKLLVPMKVQLVRDKAERKTCIVLLKSLSMKWYEERNILKLVLIVIETEFRRDYSEGAQPEWTISMFDVVQCVLIGGNSNNSGNSKLR